MLRGFKLEPEIRQRDSKGQIHIQKQEPRSSRQQSASQGLKRSFPNGSINNKEKALHQSDHRFSNSKNSTSSPVSLKKVSIFPYGVARNRLQQSAKRLGVPAVIVRSLDQADVLITLKSYYRNKQKTVLDAEELGLPIFVLRSNSNSQIEQVLIELFNLTEVSGRQLDLKQINQQTLNAIEDVRNGQHWVDLPPASARVRQLQHELVQQAELISHSYGKEPNRHVRVFRE
jgi:hypothetical protein